mmetsp:Transcript_117927/g.306178  ORF Transcript_117927/g.306178 Transcript_117927/m.306178 type:complete len:511 (-) Transcript_117927:94-1626(-)
MSPSTCNCGSCTWGTSNHRGGSWLEEQGSGVQPQPSRILSAAWTPAISHGCAPRPCGRPGSGSSPSPSPFYCDYDVCCGSFFGWRCGGVCCGCACGRDCGFSSYHCSVSSDSDFSSSGSCCAFGLCCDSSLCHGPCRDLYLCLSPDPCPSRAHGFCPSRGRARGSCPSLDPSLDPCPSPGRAHGSCLSPDPCPSDPGPDPGPGFCLCGHGHDLYLSCFLCLFRSFSPSRHRFRCQLCHRPLFQPPAALLELMAPLLLLQRFLLPLRPWHHRWVGAAEARKLPERHRACYRPRRMPSAAASAGPRLWAHSEVGVVAAQQLPPVPEAAAPVVALRPPQVVALLVAQGVPLPQQADEQAAVAAVLLPWRLLPPGAWSLAWGPSSAACQVEPGQATTSAASHAAVQLMDPPSMQKASQAPDQDRPASSAGLVSAAACLMHPASGREGLAFLAIQPCRVSRTACQAPAVQASGRAWWRLIARSTTGPAAAKPPQPACPRSLASPAAAQRPTAFQP